MASTSSSRLDAASRSRSRRVLERLCRLVEVKRFGCFPFDLLFLHPRIDCLFVLKISASCVSREQPALFALRSCADSLSLLITLSHLLSTVALKKPRSLV